MHAPFKKHKLQIFFSFLSIYSRVTLPLTVEEVSYDEMNLGLKNFKVTGYQTRNHYKYFILDKIIDNP